MGRHSLPDPEDSPDEDLASEPDESSESQTERFGFDRDEPGPGFGASEYRTPEYGDATYRTPQYGEPPYESEPQADYDRPGFYDADPGAPEPDAGAAGTPPRRAVPADWDRNTAVSGRAANGPVATAR